MGVASYRLYAFTELGYQHQPHHGRAWYYRGTLNEMLAEWRRVVVLFK